MTGSAGVANGPVARLAAQPWLEWPATRAVLEALLADGGSARFVGGAVRDGLLGLPVKDVDLATPLTPQAVIARLQQAGLKAVPTGIAHGTITAVADHKPFEITTLRHDVETFGRHARVAFTEDWRADAARRDFTMNALYADGEGWVYDYFGGVEDARAGRVRFIGDPAARIDEDALRVLRFFRFHAHYGQGAIDQAGLAACAARHLALSGLSWERIRDEVLKLLAAPDPTPSWTLMRKAAILEAVLPELTDTDRLARLVAVERHYRVADPLRRLIALLPMRADVVAAVVARLRLRSRDSKRALAMVGTDVVVTPLMSVPAARAALYALGREGFIDRLLMTATPEAELAFWLDFAEQWHPPSFPLAGKDVLEAGWSRGPSVGEALKILEQAWIDSDFKLSREALLARLSSLNLNNTQ